MIRNRSCFDDDARHWAPFLRMERLTIERPGAGGPDGKEGPVAYAEKHDWSATVRLVEAVYREALADS